MTYSPHLEDCVSCRREWKEGDKVFAFYEDYMCEDCAKDVGQGGCREELHALPPTEREAHFEVIIAVVFVIFVSVLFFWGLSTIGEF